MSAATWFFNNIIPVSIALVRTDICKTNTQCREEYGNSYRCVRQMCQKVNLKFPPNESLNVPNNLFSHWLMSIPSLIPKIQKYGIPLLIFDYLHWLPVFADITVVARNQ